MNTTHVRKPTPNRISKQISKAARCRLICLALLWVLIGALPCCAAFAQDRRVRYGHGPDERAGDGRPVVDRARQGREQEERRPSRIKAHASPRREPALTRAALVRGLRRYRNEPSVSEVVHAALAAKAKQRPSPKALSSRARRSGWLPSVRLSARRGQGWDLYESQSGTTTSRLSTDDNLTLEAALTFDLARLVYARDEVALMREQRAWLDSRAALMRQIVELYFERRRLQLERDLLGRKDAGRLLRIAEIEALLDAFTGGAFGRMLASPHVPQP
ncbi:MAG: hypothetical protein MJD61_14150 [Proteobacteria bacterium]|nr:hypothetical protein [Pseudomonadota bacterium]